MGSKTASGSFHSSGFGKIITTVNAAARLRKSVTQSRVTECDRGGTSGRRRANRFLKWVSSDEKIKKETDTSKWLVQRPWSTEQLLCSVVMNWHG